MFAPEYCIQILQSSEKFLFRKPNRTNKKLDYKMEFLFKNALSCFCRGILKESKNFSNCFKIYSTGCAISIGERKF